MRNRRCPCGEREVVPIRHAICVMGGKMTLILDGVVSLMDFLDLERYHIERNEDDEY